MQRTLDTMAPVSESDAAKGRVRRYFDREVDGYLDAYQPGRSGDARRDTFRERRDLVLGMTPASARRVLDIGAGPGVFTRQLLDRGADCWVVDLSHEMVATASRHVPGDLRRACFMVGDLDRLPFADGSFDAALCVGVLQYLPSLEFALAELARVTARGGHVIVTFPNAQSPLNRLHRVAITVARAARAVAARLGLAATPDPSRLTFRRDIPNRGFSTDEIERFASAAGLTTDKAVYHVLQFPFSVPGFGALVGAWNRFVRGRSLRGPFVRWGREGILRLARAG
ncbi:MAG: class I SAM-dependent methyltransferase [Acidobacteria bacterium]|nr:class I SAM-dependent methyltransferase [Acidobacteriota bacterium]